MTDPWGRFLADEQWRKIKARDRRPPCGDLLGDIESRVLDPVPYSPSRVG